MKGTRLWQDTGSPLISGRSRRERPFWHQVLLGWAWAVASVTAFVLVVAEFVRLPLAAAPVFAATGPLQLTVGAVAYAAVPGVVGAVVGVWLARNMGWRKPWVAGAAAGVLAAFVWLALSATLS